MKKNISIVITSIILTGFLLAGCQKDPIVPNASPIIPTSTLYMNTVSGMNDQPEKVVNTPTAIATLSPTVSMTETINVPEPTQTIVPVKSYTEKGEKELRDSLQGAYDAEPVNIPHNTWYFHMAILSGEIGVIDLDTPMGVVKVDVAWVYDYAVNTKTIIKVPLPMGYETPNGDYITRTSSILPKFQMYSPDMTRADYMKLVTSGEFNYLDRGRAILPKTYLVYNQNSDLVWKKYSNFSTSRQNVPVIHVEIGKWLDEKYPGVNSQYVNGTLTDVPDGWVPWGFQNDVPGSYYVDLDK